MEMQVNFRPLNGVRWKPGYFLACTVLPVAFSQAVAQAPLDITEPKSPGIFYLLDAKGSLASLEYKEVHAGITAIAIDGEQSPVRYPAGTTLQFVVRKPDAGKDASIIFFQFDIKRGFRVLAKSTRAQSGNMAVVQFDSKDFGSNSVELTPKPLRPGEYCIGMGKNTKEAYCFGVDAAAVSTEGSQPSPAPSTAAAMTNADVTKMVAAGLSSEVIIGAIRQSAAHSFDLSIDGLISLKKSKVPDSVVAAMQQPVPSPVATPGLAGNQPTPSQPAHIADSQIPLPQNENVFYYVNASGKLGKLELVRANIVFASEEAHSAGELHEHRNQIQVKMFGAHAALRFPNGDVTIVVNLGKRSRGFFDLGNPNSIRYRRWEPTSGERLTWFSKGETHRDPDPGEFPFTTTKLSETVFKITPNEPLVPGEYCLTTGSLDTQYCFAVDPSR